mmetsp:Transcript_8632/g.39252  ORF Transcript_8632/g.39252 Transcript_8632/m.39252 type:complete len:228 (+) Transcript_8632:1484-2167(+)
MAAPLALVSEAPRSSLAHFSRLASSASRNAFNNASNAAGDPPSFTRRCSGSSHIATYLASCSRRGRLSVVDTNALRTKSQAAKSTPGVGFHRILPANRLFSWSHWNACAKSTSSPLTSMYISLVPTSAASTAAASRSIDRVRSCRSTSSAALASSNNLARPINVDKVAGEYVKGVPAAWCTAPAAMHSRNGARSTHDGTNLLLNGGRAPSTYGLESRVSPESPPVFV